MLLFWSQVRSLDCLSDCEWCPPERQAPPPPPPPPPLCPPDTPDGSNYLQVLLPSLRNTPADHRSYHETSYLGICVIFSVILEYLLSLSIINCCMTSPGSAASSLSGGHGQGGELNMQKPVFTLRTCIANPTGSYSWSQTEIFSLLNTNFILCIFLTCLLSLNVLGFYFNANDSILNRRCYIRDPGKWILYSNKDLYN